MPHSVYNRFATFMQGPSRIQFHSKMILLGFFPVLTHIVARAATNSVSKAPEDNASRFTWHWTTGADQQVRHIDACIHLADTGYECRHSVSRRCACPLPAAVGGLPPEGLLRAAPLPVHAAPRGVCSWGGVQLSVVMLWASWVLWQGWGVLAAGWKLLLPGRLHMRAPDCACTTACSCICAIRHPMGHYQHSLRLQYHGG